ncbi:LysR family transcriptional regulator [Microbacterium paraoxydans]|uniref:LysR family transcriptional regulator n=1 Tax=Microbacterium paraoxydans TaxID=199592 RepID=UPI001CF9F495|nr:LysR family transcriptional regulator [Microbacterium paraoxydans]
MDREWPFDPRHLRALEAVVRLKSFRAAAEELGYTQSAVSQQLSELERRVGHRVLERRPVRATETGQVLLDAGASLSAVMGRAAIELTALSSGDAGTLRVGAFISAAASFVPPALAQLRMNHAGVGIVLREIEQHEADPLLLHRELDLVVTFDYVHAPEKVPAGVTRTHILDDPIMAVLPHGHPLSDADVVDPRSLPADQWINTAVDVGAFSPAPAETARGGLGFDGQDFRTVLTLVDAGLGVTLLPSLLLLDPPAGVVVRHLAPEHSLVRRIFVSELSADRVRLSQQRLVSYLADAASQMAVATLPGTGSRALPLSTF